MTGYREPPAGQANALAEAGRDYDRGTGWLPGDPYDYDRDYAVDSEKLRDFLAATQPETLESLDLYEDSPTRRKFLARLQGEISKRGVIDVLRHGGRHSPVDLVLFYGTPRPTRRGTRHFCWSSAVPAKRCQPKEASGVFWKEPVPREASRERRVLEEAGRRDRELALQRS